MGVENDRKFYNPKLRLVNIRIPFFKLSIFNISYYGTIAITFYGKIQLNYRLVYMISIVITVLICCNNICFKVFLMILNGP
jgi:hypothetical protein